MRASADGKSHDAKESRRPVHGKQGFRMVSYVRGGFAKLLLAFLVISDIAVPQYAAALTIPAQWKYGSAELGPGSLFFDSGDAACAYSAVPMYERACVRMGTTYSNAHYFFGDPQYGQGCSYTITSWENCPYSDPPSTVYAQNWVLRQAVCPWPLTQSGSNCVGPDDVTPPNCCYLTQSPVQISKGWKFWSETDFAKPFQFTRYYTSRPTNNFLNGGLSPHWRHTYDRSVSATTDPTKVWLLRPDGSYMPFIQGSNGSWTPIFPSMLQLSSSSSGYAVVTEQDDQETYDANGVLTSIQTRDGRVYTLRYDDWGLIASVTDDQGRVLTFTATSDHANIASVTDPSGTQLQFQYTQTSVTQMTAVSWTDAGGVVRQRTYLYESSDPTLLTGIIDESGQRYSTYAYDSNGRVTSTALWSDSTHQVNQTTFTYPNGTTTTVTSPLGAASTYTSALIAGAQRMAGNTVPCAVCGSGTAQATSYDTAGYPQSTTDFNGNIVQQTYDDTRGLETQRIEGSNTSSQRTITTLWDPNFRVPDQRSTVNANNMTVALTTWSYNARGQALSRCQIDPAVTGATSYVCGSSSAAPTGVRQSTYTYCEQSGITAGTCPLLGLVLTVDGPRTDVSDVATYTYYQTTDLSGCATGGACHSLGDLRSVTDALGHVTTYNTYNANGYPLTMTDPNGVVTTLTYDVRQRLSSRTVGSEQTSFTHYPTGLLSKVTLPDGSFLSFLYDAAHRLTEIDDSLGNRVVYTLDAIGNRTAEKAYDPSGVLHRTHARAYNSLNELYQDINAAGTSGVTTTYGYDNNGNQTTINAPLTRNTTNAYDPLNRLTQITDPASGNTYFGFDSNDNLTSVKDPRTLTTSYGYNGFGDVTTQSSPDSGSTTNTYDSSGNLATSTDARGAISTYAYDALNRVTSIGYQSGGVADQTLVFSYDAGTNGKGKLTSASDANHALSWTYDGLGRVTGKGLTVGTVSKSVGYAYTNADLTALVTPSGQNVVYGYNSNHQVVSVTVNGTTVLSGVTYEPFGGVSGWTWGNAAPRPEALTPTD
jgi:YD repeat-containing protein